MRSGMQFLSGNVHTSKHVKHLLRPKLCMRAAAWEIRQQTKALIKRREMTYGLFLWRGISWQYI